jgi:HTH-type transcriptional regulator/antitoxin HigA
MGVMTTALDEKKYQKLVAKAMPKVIETDEEFHRMVAVLEKLDIPERELSPEEEALASLLEKLIMEYDDTQYPVFESPPDEALRALLEQRGLKQIDLVPVLGSRAQVSAAVNGKRGISKAQAKKLADFFHCSVKLFI